MTAAAHRLRGLLGDGPSALRDPIDLARLTFAGGALVIAAMGNIPGALRLMLTFALVVGVRMLDLPRFLDFGFVAGMLLQAWGNVLDLFEAYGFYDNVVHFTLSMFSAPVFYVLLVRLRLVPDLSRTGGRHHSLGMMLVAFTSGLAFGTIYEVYEYVAVRAFGAQLQIGYADTISDLAIDAIGSLAGGALLLLWSARGWQATRRPSPRADSA